MATRKRVVRLARERVARRVRPVIANLTCMHVVILFGTTCGRALRRVKPYDSIAFDSVVDAFVLSEDVVPPWR